MSGISLFILPDIWVTYKYSINCICLWAVYLSHYSKMIYNGHLLHKQLTSRLYNLLKPRNYYKSLDFGFFNRRLSYNLQRVYSNVVDFQPPQSFGRLKIFLCQKVATFYCPEQGVYICHFCTARSVYLFTKSFEM